MRLGLRKKDLLFLDVDYIFIDRRSLYTEVPASKLDRESNQGPRTILADIGETGIKRTRLMARLRLDKMSMFQQAAAIFEFCGKKRARQRSVSLRGLSSQSE